MPPVLQWKARNSSRRCHFYLRARSGREILGCHPLNQTKRSSSTWDVAVQHNLLLTYSVRAQRIISPSVSASIKYLWIARRAIYGVTRDHAYHNIFRTPQSNGYTVELYTLHTHHPSQEWKQNPSSYSRLPLPRLAVLLHSCCNMNVLNGVIVYVECAKTTRRSSSRFV